MTTANLAFAGLNNQNLRRVTAILPAVSSSAAFSVTVPADMIGKGWRYLSSRTALASVSTAPGARTWTGVDAVFNTYVENTGVLTLTASAAITVGSVMEILFVSADN